MATGITQEYESLIGELGYDTSGVDAGFVRGEALRSGPSGDGLDDRRFRYASVLNPDKLGVTDVFEINGAPCIYMKSLAADPTAKQIRDWHRTAWNHGLGRMLWVVTPTQIRVFNAFAPPPKSDTNEQHPAELLRCSIDDLEQLRRYELDRISLESGQFWSTRAGKRITKNTRIDVELANDLQTAAVILTDRGCKPLQAHRLMLRTLFTAYLEARGVLSSDLFDGLNGKTFGEVLNRVGETRTFFERMRDTFNGDLFPPPPTAGEEDESYSFAKNHLDVARAIVTRRNLRSGQQTFDFWQYDFEVIPIELISSIYERFIYADDQDVAKARGTHYTPVNLVDLVFSQVFDDHLFSKKLPTDAKVLDLACGSGVFLVDAFRRLVARRIAGGEEISRRLVRNVLSKQVFGVDVNETAIEIAAFSLCLTAFELDPSLRSAEHLKFRHSLRDRNLFVGDAFSSNGFSQAEPFRDKQFSVVVGNPPWNKPKGGRSTSQASSRSHIEYCEEQDPPIELPFRSPIDQAFIWRSRDFLQKSGRLGLILDAKNFFSQEGQSLISKQQLFTEFRARAMLNLSVLHDKKLFPSAKQPAMVFVAEHSKPKKGDQVVFASAERSESFRSHGIVELFLERLNHLPVERIPHEPHLFKIASYGTARDRAIIQGLFENFDSTQQVLEHWGTKFNRGFQKTESPNPVPPELIGQPKLEAVQINRFLQGVASLPPFEYETMEHARDPEIYKGPVFMAQQSFQDDRLTGAVSNRDLVYSRTYFGVPVAPSEAWRLDLLNAYINSSLAMYCFFMTATRFGIDKQIAEQNDFDRLPFRNVTAKEGVRPLSRVLRTLEKAGGESDLTILDNAVFEFYGLPTWQREYVTDTIKYDLDFVRHGSKSESIALAEQEDLKTYASTIVKFVRSNLAVGELSVNADVIANLPDLGCVVIRFDGDKNRGVCVADNCKEDFSARLAELLHAPLTSNIQIRRSLIHFDDDYCIIVKLSQKRFWSRARAYDDADSIFEELLRGGT
ncbi:N-6 DNA Methylase [Thalassoglobus neptunius]|uniref:site-specific DNA-methyltransferase (adenine-specific) n=1 Tax=Thalassoglobus neptunius TaxID=1938619 RepID=A0A5C5WNN3_9PLAN|nr:N-6 DNA methylase [Thalassoglobus neptunius]TWT51731.1 N-6 DNA Methylase [Thalassoglobus neptunius]